MSAVVVVVELLRSSGGGGGGGVVIVSAAAAALRTRNGVYCSLENSMYVFRASYRLLERAVLPLHSQLALLSLPLGDKKRGRRSLLPHARYFPPRPPSDKRKTPCHRTLLTRATMQSNLPPGCGHHLTLGTWRTTTALSACLHWRGESDGRD